MTDQTARTLYAHKIRYGVTGAPLLPNPDLPTFGVIPALVELVYSAARDGRPGCIGASVTGCLHRDGEAVQPESQTTQHYSNGPDGWPQWLANEARHHAGIRDTARTAAGQQVAVCAMPEFMDCDCNHLTGCQHPVPVLPESALCGGPVLCEDGGQLCDKHEREYAHAEGEHAFCGTECAAGQPAAQQPADRATVLREAADTLPEQLRAVLAERYADNGNPFSRMVIHFQGPDGWPATKPVGPNVVAEVLQELLRRMADEAAPAVEARPADLLADCATEYHVPVPEGGGTNLLVRRQALVHGMGWAVSTRAYGGGRAWTTEGWQESISALSVNRLFCWPDAATAVREARRALAQTDEAAR